MFRIKIEKRENEQKKKKEVYRRIMSTYVFLYSSYATEKKCLDPAFSLERLLLRRGTKVFVYCLL